MRRSLVLAWLVVCCSAWVVSARQDAKQEKDKKGDAKPTFKLSADEKEFVDLTNQERKQKDLPPLKVNRLLCEVARSHSANMAKQEKMDHVLDGKTPFDRLKAAKYPYAYAGENVAYAINTPPKEIMEGWMKSPLHRKNILDGEFVEIGLGAATSKDGTIYYTQVFGTPRKE